MVSDPGILDWENKDWGSWYLYNCWLLSNKYPWNWDVCWEWLISSRTNYEKTLAAYLSPVLRPTVLQVLVSDLSVGSGDACVPLGGTNLHTSGPVGPVQCWAGSGCGWWGSSSSSSSSSRPPQDGPARPPEPRPGSAWAWCLLNQWEVSLPVTTACSASAFRLTLSHMRTATRRLRSVLWNHLTG